MKRRKIDTWIFFICMLILIFQNNILPDSHVIFTWCIVCLVYIGIISVLTFNKQIKKKSKVVLISLFLISLALNLYFLL